MKIRAGLVGGLAALTLLGACATTSYVERETTPSSAQPPAQNIITKMSCTPVSVASTGAGYVYFGGLAIVVDCDGRRLLASTNSGANLEIAEAVALVRAEIDDGDKEPLTLEGKFKEGNRFDIDSLTVSGYRISF